MVTTRGNLAPAKITRVDSKGFPVAPQKSVNCMFNPFEYTVTKTNQYEPKGNDGSKMELKKSSPQELKLALLFDTYELGTDVSLITRELWDFMSLEKDNSENIPYAPFVAFEWGSFRFISVIKNMKQQFTLFNKMGLPVRAKVTITFIQYNDVPDYLTDLPQNPTSGGGPIEEIWIVKRGDRLDLIAKEAYGDPTLWRNIADYNDVVNPFSLRPGQNLTIPLL